MSLTVSRKAGTSVCDVVELEYVHPTLTNDRPPPSRAQHRQPQRYSPAPAIDRRAMTGAAARSRRPRCRRFLLMHRDVVMGGARAGRIGPRRPAATVAAGLRVRLWPDTGRSLVGDERGRGGPVLPPAVPGLATVLVQFVAGPGRTDVVRGTRTPNRGLKRRRGSRGPEAPART